MLFCDSDIVTPARNLPRQFVDSGTTSHGCRDPHYPGVLLRQANQRLSKNIRISWNRSFLLLGLAGEHMKWGDRMIFDRITLRRCVTLAFCGQHMDQGRTVNFLEVLQSCDHFCDVVTVDGTDVLEAQAFEKKPRRDEAQEGVFQFACRVFKILSSGETQEPTRELLLNPNTE